MAQKTALLLGATGLTGGFLLTELINSGAYSKIIVPARRHLATDNPIVDQVVTDFKNLDAIKDRLVADDVYCCLGTTIAVAKTKEAFRFVDYELPLAFAKIAKEQGAKSFNLMSSIGAKVDTSTFYLKTKGEVERDIAALPFKRVNIFRPSMLLGPRKETRSGESIGKVVMTGLNFLWKGPLKNYKPIESADVAKAMAKIGVRGEGSGLRILESAEIQAVADKK
jgi:uncharacterized protein YbjT (DUF2867 family)